MDLLGRFPIEIEAQISKLSYLYIMKIAKLYVISLLILVSILIGNPPTSLYPIFYKMWTIILKSRKSQIFSAE